MAIPDMWHAAAAAIENAAATDIDTHWPLDLAGFIREEAGPQAGLVSFHIILLYDDEEQGDVARRYVRRAVDAHGRTA